MTPREQALLNSIKATVAKDLHREIVQLKRKVSRIIAPAQVKQIKRPERCPTMLLIHIARHCNRGLPP